MYNTSKKQLIIDFMTEHKNTSASIDEWINLMQSELGTDIPVRSSVYRIIQNLVKEKKVIRVQNGSKNVKYSISCCLQSHDHLHLKCVNCGELTHVNDAITNSFLEKINSDYNFNVNSVNTIIYGKCTKC